MIDNKIKSFTLIETAIVIGVIGLLLSSVILTKNIIFKSRLDSVITDIKKIADAAEQFETKYGALPGDMINIKNYFPSATNGNGNGMIDSSIEALQFWYHLKLVGLLNYNFDGTSSYIAATYNNPGGIFSGTLDNSSYSIAIQSNLINLAGNPNSGKIIVNISYFPANNYTTSILTPADALYLDKKFDDGNPNTGLFRSSDGSDVSSGSCVSSSAYNTANPKIACYSQMIVSAYRQSANTTSATCSTGKLGSNSFVSTCPEGYRGFYTQSCDSNGNLTITDYACELIKCADGKSYGDTIVLPCPNEQIGAVTYTCGKGGVYTMTANCNIKTSGTGSASCTGNYLPAFYTNIAVGNVINSVITNPQAKVYACVAGSLSPLLVDGAAICSFGNYTGSTRTISSGYSCPTNYIQAGNMTEACVLSLVNNAYNLFKIVKHNCIPSFGSCTSGDTSRLNMGCPITMTGSYGQICNNDGYWETSKNTCTPVTCGGEPIGAIRAAQGVTCPLNNKGMMIEICDYTNASYNAAKWQLSTRNCNPQL